MIAFFPSVTKPFRQSRLVKLKPLWTVAIVPSSSFSNPNIFRLSSFLSLSHSRTLITHWISFIHEIFESQSRSFNLSVTDSISQFEAFNRYWFYFSIAISQFRRVNSMILFLFLINTMDSTLGSVKLMCIVVGCSIMYMYICQDYHSCINWFSIG
jgi:hypothetical protein